MMEERKVTIICYEKSIVVKNRSQLSLDIDVCLCWRSVLENICRK